MILEEVWTLIVKCRCLWEKSLKNAKALTAIKLQKKIFVRHFVWKVSSIQELKTSIKRLWKWNMLSESKAACLLLSLNLILDNKTCLTAKWFRLLEDYDQKTKLNKPKEWAHSWCVETITAISLYYLVGLAIKDFVQITVKIKQLQIQTKKIINVLILYYDLVFIAFISLCVC